ncbi:MAG: TIGR03905 family TSCPD domain-containing protein [Lachnospiraceae bacterium]|nr:TIGR03905 family TSCPD domain-containing protein [Lachnospiraceae bacterium]
MTHTYKTKGTCSKQITFDLNDGIISNVSFVGGCNGNLQGVSKLVEGQKAEDVLHKLKGIRCGVKPTSCPDQLALAIEEALNR